MSTTETPERLYTSRELSEYAARAVRRYAREHRINLHWRTRTITYRTPVGETGWSLRSYVEDIAALEILRTLAQTDTICAKLLKRMEQGGSAMRARVSFFRHIDDPHRRVPKIRDPQRSRCYRAEDRLRDEPLENKEAAEQFIQMVAQSDWWAARSGLGKEHIRITHRVSRTASSHSARRWITLAGRWSWSRIVCLHELAHLLAPNGDTHSPLFAACHIALTHYFMGGEAADQLKQTYLDTGVKVATDASLERLFALRSLHGYKAELPESELRIEYRPLKRVARTLRSAV